MGQNELLPTLAADVYLVEDPMVLKIFRSMLDTYLSSIESVGLDDLESIADEMDAGCGNALETVVKKYQAWLDRL